MKKYVVFLLFLLLSTTVSAQKINGVVVDNKKLWQVQEMLDNENYVAAQKIFLELYDENTLEYYQEKAFVLYGLSLSNYKLNNNELAEKYLLEFIDKYSESYYVSDVRLMLAKLYFKDKRYKACLSAYSSVEFSKLSQDDKEEYFYQMAYSYLKTDQNDKASAYFFEIKDGNGKFSKPASYYYAQIAFDNGNYESALQTFKLLENDKDFGNSSKQFILRINYIQEKYAAVVEMFNKIDIGKINKKDLAETEMLMANARFELEDYKEAIPLFIKYSARLNREEVYRLAYSYMQVQEYPKAVSYFEKVLSFDDVIKQNALYNIGICYLQLANSRFAVSSFRDASKMNFDDKISENALFNYIYIIYETGFDTYSDAIKMLQKYIETHKNSNRLDEANSLMAKLFLLTKDYQNALESIDRIEVKQPELKIAYQKITFSSGIKKYNERNYSDAISLFNNSRKYSLDKKIFALSEYWTAESYYNLGNYTEAENYFTKFLSKPDAYDYPEYNSATYALGYSHFKQKDYSQAEKYFRNFVNVSDDKLMNIDAWNRIGDCYFIQNNYNQAIKSYDKAISLQGNGIDYSYYYKALAQGAMGNLNEKATTLQSILKLKQAEVYRSSAIFELANTYTLLDKIEDAITTYNQVISEYPRSPYSIKSKQKIGLLYYAKKDYSNAEKYLKNVITSYPGTMEANESMSSLKNVYVDQNKTDEYMDFAGKTANVKVSASEADSMTFSGAQNLYMTSKYPEAKKSFKNYLEKYPQGVFAPIAYYFLGECYFIEKDYSNALVYYEQASGYQSAYKENAEIQAAKIYYNNENYAKAIDLLKKIDANTEYDYVSKAAKIELMRCFDQLSDYENLLPIAKAVRMMPDLSNNIIEEADVNIANAQYGLGRYDDAYTSFSAISNNYKNESSAEAKYFCALITFFKGDYKKAEEEVFILINKGGNYDYWIARGFILLGDIYVKTDNLFQAKQTYMSIIDNYSGNDLKEEALEKLNKIE